MEKECAICGGYFIPKRSNQKYCPECSKDSYRLNMKLQKNLDRIARMYCEKPWYTHICKYCGREFESHDENQDFCYGGCSYKYRREHAVCEYCGKNLLEQGIEIQPNQSRGIYCSDECRNKAEWKKARELGRIGKCPECGKEFIQPKSGKTYCSMICYRNAVKSKRVEIHTAPKLKTGVCRFCGREYRYGRGGNSCFCGEQCMALYKRMYESRRAEEKAKQKAEAEKKAMQNKEFIKQNGLCSVCKTAYADCERMKSKFVYSPEGARFENGKIVQCPKFKG